MVVLLINNFSYFQEYVWLQEEPLNSGAFTFMAPRLGQILPDGHTVSYHGIIMNTIVKIEEILILHY
jgi:2-oxoglutarate dehydrogenase complex dehydrogenase (E1) component-like enzyme